MRLRPNRQATPRGGYGLDIQLQMMQNTPAVYWSAEHNSYATDGTTIYSINGIGEIRWTFPVERERYENDPGTAEARAYFFEPEPIRTPAEQTAHVEELAAALDLAREDLSQADADAADARGKVRR